MSLEANYKLQDACRSGNLKTVVLLVSQGANIHADNDGAVRLASAYGHLDVVKYLVSECSANIHAQNDYAMRWASYNGHLDVVRYLVSQGADIHADDDIAVRHASRYGYLNVAAYLVSQGAPMIQLPEFQRSYVSIYMKHYRRWETRAASRIYFWWIRRCYQMSAPSGIRMCFQNLAEYEMMCAL